MYYYKYKTEIGDIYISANQDYIIEISFTHNNNFEKKENKPILETIKQINQYLSGKRKSFDLPLKIEGSDFQKKVYAVLKEIPYGRVLSYKQVASLISSDKASRAVGNACSKNKFVIVIPCHRVISSTGLIGGYAGGVNTKRYLLNLEGLIV